MAGQVGKALREAPRALRGRAPREEFVAPRRHGGKVAALVAAARLAYPRAMRRWVRARLATVALVAQVGLPAPAADDDAASALATNGFDLSGSAVPREEIVPGGPRRDDIPALDEPKALPAKDTPWRDDEPVLGVALGGAARAYPVAILNWHEVVNDRVGGKAILVTYCPLCGTGLVFAREIDGRVRRFGVSGLLYRSATLLFDRETESLWSQIGARAITGRAKGARLRVLRSDLTRLGEWKKRHPDTTVLSIETGHRRPYEQSPYGDYAVSPEVRLPGAVDERYHPKMPTLGLRLEGGPARAYPAGEIVDAGGRVEERFGGHAVAVAYDPDLQVFAVQAPPEVEVIEGYWFAWAAFHPETSVYTAPAPKSPAP
jgi:hypothetical protein